ncbi:MAG: alpha/beta fold hydrolase [Myxococcales bacterium]|nr:alpha/beta fold hydrolase [Myxococcales bacterium]
MSSSLVAGLGLVLFGFVALACGLQRSLMFPSPPAPARSLAEGRSDVEILHVGDSETEAWFLPAIGASGPSPVLLFTHGNGELIDHWLAPFQTPRAWGVAVLLLEYPGYGRSGGSPSRSSITQAIVAAYDRLAARPDVDADRIVAYGRSLGGAAACALAAERPLAALVLESSFTSVRAMARRFGLFGPLVRDPFDNLGPVAGFEGPVLVVHGEQDEIIPVAHGRALAAAAEAAELHVLACGHNDCPRPWALLRRFLEAHALLPADG